MSRTDAKRGAALAITAVHEAIHLALQESNDSSLNSMLVDGQIAPALHLALMSEVYRGREQGSWATEMMLTKLTEQRQQVEGVATLKTARLIAGTQRRLHPPDSMMSMHRLHVGSHLVRMPLSSATLGPSRALLTLSSIKRIIAAALSTNAPTPSHLGRL